MPGDRVVVLKYRLRPTDRTKFDNPPPLDREIDAFRVRLADGEATFEMVEHHTTVDSARQRVEEYLRSWEIDAALNGIWDLSFEFVEADVIDAEKVHRAVRSVGDSLTLEWSIEAPTLSAYPNPPESFIATEDVERLWRWYSDYIEGRERLAVMVYLCLTWLQEREATNLEELAVRYRISQPVLKKMSELAANVGDEKSARKFSKQSKLRAFAEKERTWILAAVRMLIRRTGQVAASPGNRLPLLTISDLPPL